MTKHLLGRRTFISSSAGVLATTMMASNSLATTILEQQKSYTYCAFIKFIQTLSHEKLAKTLVELGFDGAEVTVRKGGYVVPEKAKTDLPKLHEIFSRHNLEISIITTDIVDIETPHAEDVLKTAASLGVERYRMGFCKYDLSKPVLTQIEQLKPRFEKLAAFNRQTGISAVYQNHSGANMVGATFWDLHTLIRDIPPKEIGCIFDIRHAVLEGGMAWPIYYNLMQPHIAAFSVKDFRWDGRQAINAPLGKGQVDLKFFKQLQKDFKTALFTVHVEYAPDAGLEVNVDELGQELKTLRKAIE